MLIKNLETSTFFTFQKNKKKTKTQMKKYIKKEPNTTTVTTYNKQPVAKKRKTTYKPGMDRIGGYYGRYNNSSGAGNNEKKYLDTTKASTTVTTAGLILNVSLNLIPQDTTESGRIGRKVIIKNLYLHGQIILPSTNTAASTSDIIRIIYYIDKQCNGATAQVTDILTTADFRSFRNLANQERFIILKDKFYDLNAQCQASGTAQTTGDLAFHIKMYKKLDLPVEFSSTTGAITEIKSNNIGVLAISEGGVGQVGYTTRIRYTDN